MPIDIDDVDDMSEQEKVAATLKIRDIMGESVPDGTCVLFVAVALISLLSEIIRDSEIDTEDLGSLREYIKLECFH